MAKLRQDAAIRPAPPDAPAPGSAEPESARSEAEERHRRISDAAYYRSQQRGFAPGGEQDDWLEAERDLDSATSGGTAPEQSAATRTR